MCIHFYSLYIFCILLLTAATVTFDSVTLHVLHASLCIHCEGHLLCSSGPCKCLEVLILHIQQSAQWPFILDRFVPSAVLRTVTNKTVRSTKGYMPHSIDCSQKYFQNYGSCLDKNKPTAKKRKKIILAQLSH